LEPKNVVLYARSATFKKPGDNNSVDMQLEKLREYARKNDYEVLAEFVDEGKGGNIEDRPALQKMISIVTAEPHIVDTVLVNDYSRLARNMKITRDLEERLRENNVSLVSISQPRDDSFEKIFQVIWTRILLRE